MHQWGDVYAGRIDDMRAGDVVRVRATCAVWPGRTGDLVAVTQEGDYTVQFAATEQCTYDQDDLSLVAVGLPTLLERARDCRQHELQTTFNKDSRIAEQIRVMRDLLAFCKTRMSKVERQEVDEVLEALLSFGGKQS